MRAFNISHACIHVTLNVTAAAAAVETTPDCGALSDFVAPSFGSLPNVPLLRVTNDLAYRIKVYQIESEGNTPFLRYTLEHGSWVELGGFRSGVWIATNDTDYIEPINGECYYIVDGNFYFNIHLG